MPRSLIPIIGLLLIVWVWLSLQLPLIRLPLIGEIQFSETDPGGWARGITAALLASIGVLLASFRVLPVVAAALTGLSSGILLCSLWVIADDAKRTMEDMKAMNLKSVVDSVAANVAILPGLYLLPMAFVASLGFVLLIQKRNRS